MWFLRGIVSVSWTEKNSNYKTAIRRRKIMSKVKKKTGHISKPCGEKHTPPSGPTKYPGDKEKWRINKQDL